MSVYVVTWNLNKEGAAYQQRAQPSSTNSAPTKTLRIPGWKRFAGFLLIKRPIRFLRTSARSSMTTIGSSFRR